MVISMNRKINLWQLSGFAVTAIVGTLLHFLYEWLGEAWWIAPFSGVNESTWEHMKLLFWPMAIFALVQSLIFDGKRGFWCVKLVGTLTGLILIPVLYYTYNGAIGKSPDIVNISIFFISAAIAYAIEARLLKAGRLRCKHPALAIALLCILALLFVTFTFAPPPLGIFVDPITGECGM